jgi:hypothetical protein
MAWSGIRENSAGPLRGDESALSSRYRATYPDRPTRLADGLGLESALTRGSESAPLSPPRPALA